MMTQNPVEQFINSLTGKTTASKLTQVYDLLKHANEDRMSPEDRTICVQAKRLLSYQRSLEV